MTGPERRSVAALAGIYASRMLGLFLPLPVLALYARGLPDYSPQLFGVAMGAYGLTQAVFQIPFGSWSDRIGRKTVITWGLALFAVGSVVGALAHSLVVVAIARAIQGVGAVSAAVTALLADLTRPEVRTRAMAVVGISIGLSFVAALVLAPILDAHFGVPGIFVVMLVLALTGIALLHLAVPDEPPRQGGTDSRSLRELLRIAARRDLGWLYFGIFSLHFIMTATFMSVPLVMRDELAIPSVAHSKVYLGVFLASIIGTLPLVMRTDRSAGAGALFVWSILALAFAEALLGADHAHKWAVLAALTLFFAVFNYLEARMPALLTLAAGQSERGAALGIFSVAQTLGIAAGGLIGGRLLQVFGNPGVFWGAAVIALFWAALASRSVASASK
jgi:predicted MFS family arabinose efflux permease